MNGANDNPEHLGRRVLTQNEHFDLVLRSGERMSCTLLAWGLDAVLVESGGVRYLIQQHAIDYAVLDDGPELVESAASVAAATSILGESPLPSPTEVFTIDPEHPDPPVP